MTVDKERIQSILATDCGSTTTKAILIEKVGEEFRLMFRGEAPTTVEAPVEDVTRGVINAVSEVQEIANRTLLTGENIAKPRVNDKGVDIYISTSSAGGGLQMMVAGVVKQMTAESAERAALGAGAIVMDVIASNDGRLTHQKTERIRKLRPDMILLSGGTDAGNIRQVVELAEIIAAADPRPRLGIGYELPVIFAGNIKARDEVKKRLEEKTALVITDNLRPTLEEENLMPARMEIQEQFLEHVMSHAPGYKTLMEMTDVDIMPTPAAVGYIMERIAKERGIQVIGVDIGGATTDVFSVFQGTFNRTVSANYGMSYSISNVFADSGMDNIMRWVPFDIDEKDLRNRVKNKMIRPTSIPQTLEELMIEQALAREALALSFQQHKELATGLKGVQRERTVAEAFDQTTSGETLVDLMRLDMLIGSGGVLSHAPRRAQSTWMLMDAFLPEGITQLTVDSIFMMPQLGVLAQVHPEAATQVFIKDCLIYLGTCIAPVGGGKEGRKMLTGTLSLPGDREIDVELNYGELKVIPLKVGLTAEAELQPARGFDLGEGKGAKIKTTLHGGVVGIILDGRGRNPFNLPKDKQKRIDKLHQWAEALKAYPVK
ncbi:MAG: glutamate mutase L [Candidatus Eremiobacteraeota bacterium]|nr:glutamate mutase L [Candidatus Eremiobacteraeota bacterium]